MASLAGDERTVKMLLARGADPGTALAIAADMGSEKIFDVLLGVDIDTGRERAAGRVKAFVTAARPGNAGIVVDVQGGDYESVLDAAGFGCWQIVDMLLSHTKNMKVRGCGRILIRL
jgi:hypothetical protein